MLFDSHAHLNNDTFDSAEREALAAEIEAHPIVSYIADIGFDLPSSVQAALDSVKYDWCYAAVGVHPHDTRSMTEEILDAVKYLALEYGASAIGEIGLDYHYMLSPKEDQRYWFRRQIRLANELALPIVVHSREAAAETMDILKEEGTFSDKRKAMFPERPAPGGKTVPDARVDIHCFSGSADMALEYVSLGATIGICGPITYKNNRKTITVAEALPIEFMMVETDSPYMAPEPMRGRPNRSWYVEYTARKLAEIKGMSFEDAARATCENALRFYGKKHRPLTLKSTGSR
ncbi:MAG: TatD family hydrolase [Eubacterium sp.]|jgi:TatD DNase family protein